MERIIRTTLLLAGIVMLITGCERLQPPETPIPLSPDEMMIKEASPVVFFWQTVDEADYYALQIATDEEFENTIYVDSTIKDTTLTIGAESFEKLTMYYWQVAASNSAGSSEWSKTNRFFYGTQDWLISPADSVIFDTDAPTLVWHSYPQTTGYVVRICRNSFSTYNTIWEDTVSDTAYQLPYEFLLENHPSSYHWSVLFLGTSEDLFWAPSRCFFSRIMPDLDTTYFPFGLGYEWCYERHNTGYKWVYDDTMPEYYRREAWDYYDTVNTKVIDSFWITDTLFFQLDSNYLFLISNPVKISYNQIKIAAYVMNWIPLFPEEIDTIEEVYSDIGEHYEFKIGYSNDTLCQTSSYWWWWEFPPYGGGGDHVSTKRIKGIGAINQGSGYNRHEEDWDPMFDYAGSTTYRLLSFKTPQGG